MAARKTTTKKPATKRAPKAIKESVASVRTMTEIPEMTEFTVGSSGEMSLSTAATTRRNRAGNITRTNRFDNIEQGTSPFVGSTGSGSDGGNVSIRQAVVLCQKAYYNIAIFRNTIDLMTDFSMAPIYWTGGNKESRKFFESWANRIDLDSLQEQWFTEYYRSGNVFLFKINASFAEEDRRKFKEAIAKLNKVPVRYIVLNPAEIELVGSSNFTSPDYVKVINDYELQRLVNPQNETDKKIADMVENLDKIKKNIKSGQSLSLYIKLGAERLATSFYKKQDYEPFSVPLGFAVLDDVNWKLELKKYDQAISRTVMQAVLHIKMGDKDTPASQKAIQAMRDLFKNESVGKTLVSDYTTEIKFVLPEISNILDPKKYEIVDKDIREGLNNILYGDQKFSNTSVKMDVFLARLRQARKAFIQKFLIKEIKKIGKELGYKTVPTPNFEDSEFEDKAVLSRIYSRFVEIGALTPQEGFEALEKGKLPTSEESKENQEEFKKDKDRGLYQPIMGGKITGDDANAGRPTGTGTPQKTQNPSPPGRGEQSKANVFVNMREKIRMISELEQDVYAKLKAHYNKRSLTKEQTEIAKGLLEMIVVDQESKNWKKSVASYVKNPVYKNQERIDEIGKISMNYGLDMFSSALWYESIK